MKKIQLSILAIILAFSGVHAQTAEDALRYSRIFYGGTARFNGLGGAFGAVGADFSTLATNPAGLGLYRGSEMTLTLTPHFVNNSSTYNGNTTTDNRGSFGMGNFGMVFSINTSNTPSAGKLKYINFGIGYNRQNDFNNDILISGINTKNSLMQSYVNYLHNNYIAPNALSYEKPFDIGLAYDANLVVYDSSYGYFCDAQYGGVAQSKYLSTYGSINELDFSVGANYDDKLYMGLTVGVPFISYSENTLYKETRVSDTVPNFITLDYYYNLRTRGTGVNVKFGLIYKPLNWMRVGVAIHTPTWYPSMSDEWSSNMHSVFDTSAWNRHVYSPMGYYDYKLTTPFRAMFSLAFIVSQYGLISADYEYVNYSQAKFNSSTDSYKDVNDDIKSTYKSWGNLRLGTEWRFMDFRVRGGFGYFSSPYSSNTTIGDRFQYSGGIGYRAKSFFADLTYSYSTMKQNYYLYDPAMVNPANITNHDHTISATLGFRF